MPDSLNLPGTANSEPMVPAFSQEQALSPQRRDEIYDSIPAAEWDRFLDSSQVAIGRRKPGESFSILAGFDENCGEALANFAMALPPQATFFLAWHRRILEAKAKGEIF